MSTFWRALVCVCVLFSLALVWASPAHAAAIWYVSAWGNDSNDCLSPETPCSTIGEALRKAAPGGMIYTARGYINFGWSDSVTKPMTFLGGWDEAFTQQNGWTEINRLYSITQPTTLDRFWIRKSPGAGIECHRTSVTLSNSSITDHNTNYYGAGILAEQCNLTLVNTNISDNSTPYDGAGIYLYGGDASNSALRMYNVTLAFNRADRSAGGIYTTGTPIYAQNTLIANNTTGGSGPNCLGGSITSLGYSLFGDLDGCTFTPGPGDILNTPAGIVSTGVAFGVTALQYNSPAINAGAPEGCKDEAGNLLTHDVRDVPYQGICDIGAFEYVTPGSDVTLYATGGQGQHVPPGAPFPAPLTAQMFDSIGNLVHDAPVTFTAPASGASAIFADTGTYSVTALSDASGTVSSGALSANLIGGTFVISATTPGATVPVTYTLESALFYLSPNGNDGNTCVTPADPCATLEGVQTRPLFRAGDTILAEQGVYTGSGAAAVVTKGLILHGGYDAAFSAQTGMSTFDGQSARGGMLVQLAAGTSIEMDHLIFANGNPYGLKIATASPATLTDIEVYNSGMGISQSSGTWVLRRAYVHDNSPGGGISNWGTLILWDSALTNNRNSKGGGLANYGTAYIHNTTISGNHVELPGYPGRGEGGGIYSEGGKMVYLYNVTVANNTSDRKGAGMMIWGPTSAVLENSLVVNNKSYEGPNCWGKVASHGYNIIGNMIDCEVTSSAGDSLSSWDQALSPLGNYGGTTPIFALYSTSPALDGGNPAGCRDYQGNLLTNDQRGLSRPQDGNGDGIARCDIGAFESAYPALPPAPRTIWYVSSTYSSDSFACNTPSAPCKTINGAIDKAAALDYIYVKTGAYAANDTNQVVYVTKDINLSGGWDSTYTAQTGVSSISGSNARQVVKVDQSVRLAMDHFTLSSGNTLFPGGGMQLFDHNWVILRNMVIGSNHAGTAGGLYVSGDSIAEIYNSTISNNQADNEAGGIYVSTDAQVWVYNSIITGNRAYFKGGGIWAYSATVKLYGTTIRQNSVSNGNGGGIYSTNYGTVVIVNSTFHSNSAYNGGAIYTDRYLYIHNSTIGSNTATASGGGIYYLGAPHLSSMSNSIVYGNTAFNSPDCYGAPGNGGYNLIGSLTGCGYVSATGDQIGVNPRMSLAQGTTSLFFTLATNSPAIDGGNPGGCYSEGALVTTSQNGVSRPMDGDKNGYPVCDMGSYEYGPTWYLFFAWLRR